MVLQASNEMLPDVALAALACILRGFRVAPGNDTSTEMAKLPETEKGLIDGPAGKLQIVLDLPRDQAPVACAVICHPHPVHGGTLLNKVTHTLARAFVSQNIAALRFNFRGVGDSDGDFDDGKGEILDVLAALGWLRDRYSSLPYWLAGFSFGGAMAMHAAVEAPPTGLVSVAPAIYRFAKNPGRIPDCPWLIVQGDKDELVDIDETVAYVDSLDPGPHLSVFPDGDHFFHGRLVELRNTVEAFIQQVT